MNADQHKTIQSLTPYKNTFAIFKITQSQGSGAWNLKVISCCSTKRLDMPAIEFSGPSLVSLQFFVFCLTRYRWWYHEMDSLYSSEVGYSSSRYNNSSTSSWREKNLCTGTTARSNWGSWIKSNVCKSLAMWMRYTGVLGPVGAQHQCWMSLRPHLNAGENLAEILFWKENLTAFRTRENES